MRPLPRGDGDGGLHQEGCEGVEHDIPGRSGARRVEALMVLVGGGHQQADQQGEQGPTRAPSGTRAALGAEPEGAERGIDDHVRALAHQELDESEARIRDLAEEPFQERTQDVSRPFRGKRPGGKEKDQGRPSQGGEPVAEKVLSSQ